MTVTTIYRVFFTWKEFQAMKEFEAKNAGYKKVGEDTTGVMYEYRADYHTAPADGKDKNETD